MRTSLRIKSLYNMVPKGDTIADIGTDHGYIPILSLLNEKFKRAIASDVNEGPLKIAKKNASKYYIEDKIDFRLGDGLSILKSGEADVIVIAGMGGNLISDIIKEDIAIARSAKYLILQPVQYPEVLRKFLISNGFEIIDEDITYEDGKFYYIIVVKVGISEEFTCEAYYYTGKILIEKRNKILRDYVLFKINQLGDIIEKLTGGTPERKNELTKLKKEFEEVLSCL